MVHYACKKTWKLWHDYHEIADWVDVSTFGSIHLVLIIYKCKYSLSSAPLGHILGYGFEIAIDVRNIKFMTLV